MTFHLFVEIKARNESRYFCHAYDMCCSQFFFLNHMKCSFFRNYMCVFDINLFILNEDLFICQQPTPVASNIDAAKISTMFASQLARDVSLFHCGTALLQASSFYEVVCRN